MAQQHEGYKQTINYSIKESQRKNKRQIKLRPDSEALKNLELYKLLTNARGSDQQVIYRMMADVVARIEIEKMYKEDLTTAKLIRESKDAEKIYNRLIKSGYTPYQRKELIKLVKEGRMKKRLEKLDEEWRKL